MSVCKYTYSWESLRSIDLYRSSFPVEVERRRVAAQNKIDYYDVGIDCWSMDYRNMPILTMANIVQQVEDQRIRDHSYDILMCGSIGGNGHPCACGKHWYCQYDCWVKGRGLTGRYPNLFNTPTVGFTKACFNPNIVVNMSTCHKDDIFNLWNLTEKWVKTMLEEQMILGAYVCREVKINSYANHSFLPHTHLLIAHHIDTPIASPALDYLSSKDWRANNFIHTDDLDRINTCFKPIEDERELTFYLRYLHKPIDLMEAYNTDILVHPTEVVNHAVENDVTRFNYYIKGMQKCRAFGVFHNKSPNYIGR